MKRNIQFLLLIIIAFISCDDEIANCQDNLEFCVLLEEENYPKSIDMIDGYLQTLDYESNNSNLETLRNWLECISCVNHADINCFWCEYSNPPHGSIILTLTGSSDTLQLNLIGSIPHKVGSIIKK